MIGEKLARVGVRFLYLVRFVFHGMYEVNGVFVLAMPLGEHQSHPEDHVRFADQMAVRLRAGELVRVGQA